MNLLILHMWLRWLRGAVQLGNQYSAPLVWAHTSSFCNK